MNFGRRLDDFLQTFQIKKGKKGFLILSNPFTIDYKGDSRDSLYIYLRDSLYTYIFKGFPIYIFPGLPIYIFKGLPIYI